jgi:maleylacetate reductase
LDVDTIVTLGAGSISDACKTVKLGHSNNVKTRDDLLKLKGKVNFKSGSIELPDIPLNPPTLKLICIPTSLSAGEYNPKSGSLDRQTGKKFPYFQGDCMPDIIICDPFLALKTPEWVWLSTGVRSIDHAVETLCNPNVDLEDPAVTNACKSAEEALTLLVPGLMRSKKDGEDVEAREMCQKGAWKASAPIVLGIPMGGSHAIGHILGSVSGVAHGHTSCVLLPAVMEFNYPVNSKQQDNIKRLLVNNGTVKDLELEGENDLMPWQIVASFIRSIGMPQSLTEVGIKNDQLPKIAKETLTDFWSRTNPIPIDTEEQAMEILQLAK